MHVWMWFGYDLGPFLFSCLDITTRWQFALTWIVLFVVALLFEASKVYLARVQRAAQKRLYPYRSDERRNLLCRDLPVEPGTSRNASHGQVERWASMKTRMLINTHQTLVFVLHNVVGYLLMLAVMVYNVELLLAVVLGMMLGYFLFGPKLTRLQMQCFRTKRVVICTPECDDTAETSTPPLLDASLTTESDYFICQTRTCIQPSHYFRASTSQETPASCHFGAKCPSKVAKAKTLQKHCHKEEPNVEDAQLLGDSCCNKEKVEVHQPASSCCKEGTPEQVREDSPKITCCSAKTTPTDSQEQII
ncbi:uncharacterized protein LOC134804371 isoform X2 [Cydia splendana]|uniref:uncharacterized protein LOC134804371 isoform X2 n=1 Tax=Cydia splendana TaxID=1100963 RepID=UPI00300D951A